MNQIKYVTTFVCLCVCFLAAGQSLRTIISGRIPQSGDSSVSVSMLLFNNSGITQDVRQISEPLDEGFFKFELLLEALTPVQLYIDDALVFGYRPGPGQLFLIEPGDSIHLVWPKKDSKLQDLVPYGQGAEKHVILNHINLGADSLMRLWPKEPNYNAKERHLQLIFRLLEYYDSALKKYEKRLDEHVYKEVKIKCAETFHYGALGQFLELDLTSPHIKDMYNQYVQCFSVDILLEAPERGGLIWQEALARRAVVEYLIQNKLTYTRQFEHDKEQLYTVISHAYSESLVGPKLLAGFIASEGKRDGWTDALESIAQKYFTQFDDTNPYRVQLEKIRTDLMNLVRGTVALEFALQDASGKIVQLSDFKGKIVLLDFMFNGCAGCAILAPKLEEIQRNFMGQDVVFISISVDKTIPQFKKGIGKFSSPSAVHLFTNGEGIDHPLIKYLNIIAFPTLVLIDRDGRIINERAARSIQELTKQLKDAI